jgi:hypothetical protein
MYKPCGWMFGMLHWRAAASLDHAQEPAEPKQHPAALTA